MRWSRPNLVGDWAPGPFSAGTTRPPFPPWTVGAGEASATELGEGRNQNGEVGNASVSNGRLELVDDFTLRADQGYRACLSDFRG